MNRLLRPPVAGAVALVLVVALGAIWRPPAAVGRAAGEGRAPIDQLTLVCPDVTGNNGGLTTTLHIADVGPTLRPALPSATVAEAAVTGKPLRFSSRDLRPAYSRAVSSDGTPVAVAAHGSGAAGVVADQVGMQPAGRGRSLTSAPCLAPATDWWFAGGDGRVGYLDGVLIADPAGIGANVTITGWGPSGALTPPRFQSLTVPAWSSVYVPIGDLAPDVARVALHVHANVGTVTADLFDERVRGIAPGGSDYDPPTAAPATRQVVPGFMPVTGVRQLYLANPTGRDASIGLRLVTRSGSFVPAGVPNLVLAAGHSTLVDLSTAFGGDGGSAVVTSDTPVVATGLTSASGGKYPDVSWQPATAPLTGPAVLVSNDPVFGQSVTLLLTAPGDGGKVELRNLTGAHTVVSVPAGRSVLVELRAALGTHGRSPGTVVLTPLDQAGIYASRTIYATGAHGPLVTSAVPYPIPAPVSLPPARYDPRAAVR